MHFHRSMVLLAIGVTAAAASPIEDAERALKEHLASKSRKHNKAFYDIVGHAETATEFASMVPGLGTIIGVKSLALYPVKLITGDTVIGNVRRATDRSMGRVLYSALERSIGDDFATIPGNATLRDLNERYNVATKLRDWSKDPKLLPEESAALVRLSDGIKDSLAQLALIRKPEHKPTQPNTIKEMAGEQVRAEAGLEQTDDQLANVEKQVLELQVLLDSATADTWTPDRVDRLSFAQRVDVARGCKKSSNPTCGGMTERQREAVITRDEIRIAAERVGAATSVYVRGSMQIASNLGVEVPDWMEKGVAGVEATSLLVSGAVSNRPDQIIGGLVGLSGLFGKPKQSADSMILAGIARLEKRLFAIQQHLVVMDKKLDVVITKQREILQSLATLHDKVDSLTRMVENVSTQLAALLRGQLRSCDQAFFTAEEAGALSAFLDRSRVSEPTDANFVSSANRTTRRRCQRGVLDALTPQPETALFWQPTDQSREDRANTVIGHARALAGPSTGAGGGVAALVPIIVAPASSRTELVHRLVHRNEVEWNDKKSTDTWLTQRMNLLSLERITAIAPFAAIFHDLRDPSQAPLLWFEAIRGTQTLLARFVFQRVVTGTDALGALVATRVIEGLPPGSAPVPKMLADIWSDATNEPMADREQRFIGDLLDASIVIDTNTAEKLHVARGSIARAFRSGRVATIDLALARAGKRTGSQFEARAVGAEVQICVRPNVLRAEVSAFSAQCLTLTAFEGRDRLEEPSEARVARWWIRWLTRADERAAPGTP